MAIDKTKLTGVEKVYPLNVSPYEQYMGDFQNPSVVSKINAMIQSLHQIGRLTNETVSQWNSVMKWIVEGGMDEIAETVTNEKVSVALEEVMRMLDVSLDNGLKELAENVTDKKIDGLLENGQFESMIQSSLVEINEVVENKLDGFNLQLAGKVGGGTKAEPEDLSERSLALVTGQGTVNLLSIPQDKSVTPTKTTFISTGKNKMNNKDWTTGERIGISTGEIVTDIERRRSNAYIDIESGKSYVVSIFRDTDLVQVNNEFEVIFYDINKTFISGYRTFSESGNVLTIPSNAKFLRFNIKSLTRFLQLEIGTVNTAFESYYIKFSEESPYVPEKIQKALDEKAGITGIKATQTDFVSVGKNLMDESTSEIGNINSESGGATTSTSFTRYGFTLINPTENHVFTVYRHDTLEPILTNFNGAYYDVNYNYISGIKYIGEVGGYVNETSFVLTIPTNAVYVRFAISNLTRKVQLEKGVVGSYYEAFNLQFKKKQLAVTNVKEVYKYGKFSNENLSNWYRSQNTTHTDFNASTTVAEFQDAFNSLLESYPAYAKITQLGMDSSGLNPIYEYELTPENVTHGVYFGEPLPKIGIINGQHGDEKEGIFALYYFVKDMLENWDKEDTLEYSRNNIRYVIIPVANPSGFEANTRTNSNDVDMNRNYDFNWEIDTSTKKGSAPFSEVETGYIRDTVLKHKDAVLFIDFHTNGSSGSEYRLTNAILLNDKEHFNQDITDASYYHIKKTTRHFAKDYDNGNNGSSFGYISLGRNESMAKNYIASQGITAAVFEGFTKFPNESFYFSEKAIKANTELLVNWLNSLVKHFRQETKVLDITKG